MCHNLPLGNGSMAARARRKSKQHHRALAIAAGILLAATLAAYWSSFHVPFVFDDLLTIQANSGVQFGDNLLPSIWATRPALYLTFALNYKLNGQDVLGYHIVNFGFHILNGLLVFLIALHIFRAVRVSEDEARANALMAAALFLLHPVQTESVTYVSSRSELLSTLFYGLGVLTFIKKDTRKIGFVWSLAVAIPFFLGLLAKETVISLPAILLAYDFLFLSDASGARLLKRWRFYMTFAAGGIAAIYFLVTRLLTRTIGADVSHIGAWPYFLTQLRVIVRYIRLLFLPAGLNLDYDFRPSASPWEASVLASGAVLLALLALAWHLRRRQPVVSFSIFWFFITLAPTSSVVPIRDVIFEHRLYLPLMGVSLAFPLGMRRLAERLHRRIPAAAIAAIVVALLAAGTIARNGVWRDEETLWADVVAKSPHKARPYNSLETVYFNRREFDKALDAARRGLENVDNPSDRRGFQEMMGQIYIQMHRYTDAAAAFRETTNVEDKHMASAAYNNLGVAYLDMAQTESGAGKQPLLAEAAAAFRKSADLDPTMFYAFDSYVNVVSESGNKDELENALRSELTGEQAYRAYYGLGKIALLTGDYESAVQQFQQALRLNGSQKLIWFNHAYALTQLHRRDEAIDAYLRVIRLDPLLVQARHNLGLLYVQTGKLPQAVESFQDALRLDPNYLSAHLNLAKVYIQLGNRSAARSHLSEALRIAPAQKEAATLLQQLGS